MICFIIVAIRQVIYLNFSPKLLLILGSKLIHACEHDRWCALVIYEVCLKSNETVHAARTTFIAEKKALLSMMSQCLVVSKTKFQHSVTTTFFLARFSVKALSL